MSARLRSDESGFTLVELLVAITISVLIMGAVGITLVAILRSMSGAQDRMGRTADTSLISYTFARDIASSSKVVGGGSTACGSGTVLVKITTRNVQQATSTGTPSAKPVWYCVKTNGQVLRYECATDASCAAGTYAMTTVLADKVAVSGTSKPAVDCQAQDASVAAGFASLGACPATLPSGKKVRRVLLTMTLQPTTTTNRAADAALPFAAYGVTPA